MLRSPFLLLLAALAATARASRTLEGAAPQPAIVTSINPGFNLVPLNATLNDCVTTCAAAWQGTVQVGQWALCAAEDANRRYYGTWRPDRKQCWYYNATLVPVPPPTGTLKPVGTTQAPRPGVAVKCGCTRPAVPVEWQADAGCMGGASAAAVGPATCRFKKLGTADNAGQWTIGWAALVKRGTASVIVCHSATVYYGLNGAPLTTVDWGTPGHNVQLLCKVPACSTATSTEYCIGCSGTSRFTCLGSGRRCLSFTQVGPNRVPSVLEPCTIYPARSTVNAEGNCPAFVSAAGSTFVFSKRSATPPADVVTECAAPSKKAFAVLPVQGKSCTETCRQAGLAPVAGEPGTALCANPEKTGWGTQAAPGENCAVQEIGSWSDGFHCACALPKEPLAWRPLATCLTGVASATGGDWPPVCRHRIEHDPARPFRTGWVTGRSGDTGDYVCRAPDGATSVDSMGLLPTEFEVLCRASPVVPACVAGQNFCHYCGPAGRVSCLASGTPCKANHQVSGHPMSATVELCSSFIERSGAVASGTGCPTWIKRNENFQQFEFKQANTSPPPEQDTLCGLPDKAIAVLPQEAHNCTHTCALAGLAAVTGGDPGTAVCMMITRDGSNTTLYGKRGAEDWMWCRAAGTWMLQGVNMAWGCYTTTSSSGADYSCVCAVPTAPLEWRVSSSCLQGAASPTGGVWPPVCRHHKNNDASLPFRTGHVVPRRWDTGNYACKAPDFGDTQGNSDGIGFLPREFEVLCRANTPLPACGAAEYCNYCGAAGRFSCLASGPPCTVTQQVAGHPLATTIERCSSYNERSAELAPGTSCPATLKMNTNRDVYTFKAASSSPPPEVEPEPKCVSTVKAFALLPQEAHNCTHTCSRAGLAPVSSGVPGASLCSRVVRDDHPIYPAGTVLYGQWFWYGSTNQDFGCYVGNAQVKWPASWPSSFSFTDFSCACAVPNQPLTWEYSPDCVAGPRATVAGGVPVCRALGRGDTLDQTLLPGYSPGSTGDNGQIICDPPFFYGTRQGPPGSDFGGIELLCRAST